MTKSKSYLMPGIFYSLFYFPLKAIFRFFSHLEVESEEDLKNLQGPLIITSSHASWIDPFLIGISFPFFKKIGSIHFAAWWKYYYFPVFTPLIWLFGGFPVRKGVGLEKALLAGSEILLVGGVIGIFPAGRRTRKWNESYQPKAKRGAAFLAIKNNVPILPIKIEGSIGMNLKSFLMRKYKIKVKIGKIFSLPYQDLTNPEDLNSCSDLVMNKIVNT